MTGDAVHAFADDALGEHDAVAIAELVRRGERSAAEVTDAAIIRVERVNARLNAVAYPAYSEPLTGEGPFAGVPTFVKDNTPVAGMPTGYGTAAFPPRPARRHDRFARQFVSAGFTVLGKSRLPEFGFNATTEFADGEPTRNFAAAEAYWRNPKLPPLGRVRGPTDRRLTIVLVTETVGDGEICPETRKTVEDTAAVLERLGHRVEPVPLPVGAGFVRDFTVYWGLLSHLVSRFGKRTLDPRFDPDLLDGFSKGLREIYRRSRFGAPATLYRLSRVRRAYAAMFRQHDLVLSPVLAHVTPKLGHRSPLAPFDELYARLARYVAFTPLNNVAGAPAISLPMVAAANGLPIGVQFSAARGDERTLLELGYELEQERPWRRIQDAPGA